MLGNKVRAECVSILSGDQEGFTHGQLTTPLTRNHFHQIRYVDGTRDLGLCELDLVTLGYCGCRGHCSSVLLVR